MTPGEIKATACGEGSEEEPLGAEGEAGGRSSGADTGTYIQEGTPIYNSDLVTGTDLLTSRIIPACLTSNFCAVLSQVIVDILNVLL